MKIWQRFPTTETMAQMMAQQPQYKGQEYDDVVATVDFTLSDHPNPKRARRKNIKNAIKALKPMGAHSGSLATEEARTPVCL